MTIGDLINAILGRPRGTGAPTDRQLFIMQTLRAHGALPGLSIIDNASTQITMGDLYSDLKRMRKRGWIESRNGEPVGMGVYRGYYYLTHAGHQVLLNNALKD